MQAATQQLIIGYERLGLTIDQLANEHSISLTEVKMMLTQYSSLYRNNCKSVEKKDPNSDFTDDDLEVSNSVIRSIINSDIEDLDPKSRIASLQLKSKMARYIRDDKKGRLDVAKEIRKIGVDLSTFNKHMQQMRERLAMKQANAAPSNSNSIEKEQPIIEV